MGNLLAVILIGGCRIDSKPHSKQTDSLSSTQQIYSPPQTLLDSLIQEGKIVYPEALECGKIETNKMRRDDKFIFSYTDDSFYRTALKCNKYLVIYAWYLNQPFLLLQIFPNGNKSGTLLTTSYLPSKYNKVRKNTYHISGKDLDLLYSIAESMKSKKPDTHIQDGIIDGYDVFCFFDGEKFYFQHTMLGQNNLLDDTIFLKKLKEITNPKKKNK